MFLEDVYDEELGVTPKPKKKKKRKIGRKIGKAFKAIATGGMSIAAEKAKKTKLGRKVMRTAGAIATGGLSVAAKKAKKKLRKVLKTPSAEKSIVAKLSAAGRPEAKPVAKAVINRVKSKKAGECTCKSELVKLVAGKLVAELAPPLDSANKMLKKAELQRAATYEHQKLMRDAEFRRKVLEFISRKAKKGNRSCQRAIFALRS